LIGNQKFWCLFEGSKGTGGQLAHVPLAFSPNASNKNFETIIKFKTVQRAFNNASRADTNPKSLTARVVSYAPGPCTFFCGRGGM
jgi:hypothetical protein